MLGEEIKEILSVYYEYFGNHHSQISSYSIDFTKKFKKLKDNVTYRVFMNDIFCAIFDECSDAKLYFFGYNRENLYEQKIGSCQNIIP